MAAPSTDPATPPPSGTTPPGTPPTGPAPGTTGGLSAGAKAGIAVAVVVILVVGVLALGLVPGVSLFPSGSSGSGSTSSSAVGHASGVAASHDAGSLVAEIGVSTTFSFSFGYFKGNASCPLSGGFASDSDNFTVPAEGSGYASGSASLWLLLYYNHTTPSESIVAVVGSSAYFIGQVTGATCATESSLPTIPADTISSSAAASALASDASAFTSAHASATAVYFLYDNATTGPEWAEIFTNCSYDPDTNKTIGGHAADVFLGAVNGTTGTVLASEYESDLNCSGLNLSGISLHTTLGPTAVGGLTGGTPPVLAATPAYGGARPASPGASRSSLR